MFTNNIDGITSNIRKHLIEGETSFDLLLTEQTLCNEIIDDILQPFYETSLPDGIQIKLNISRCNIDDETGIFLCEKLKSVKWPKKFNIELLLGSNLISNESAEMIIELCNHLNTLPEANILIDLENNNNMTHSVIKYALQNIKHSKVDSNTICNEKKTYRVEFSQYLIDEYLEADDLCED